VEAGKMEFRPEDIELRAVVTEVLGVLRSVANEKEIVPTVDVHASLGVVHLDPSRLKQVLYNYLSNAIKFSPRGGRIQVVVAPVDDTAFRLEVRDHGVGIGEDDLKRLFVEFEQLDPGRSKAHAGTGLGLALTRRLVEAQGGTVGVESRLGQGSTFFAVLPVRVAGQSTLPQPRRIDSLDLGAPRILVIEDDPDDQERIVAALVGAGYAVDTASTGAQALRAANERRYAAITLDLLLPDTNGLALLQSLRKSHADGVPVIVISVVSEQVTGGFVVQDALQKPLRSDELLASLRRAGVQAPLAGPVLVVDDDEASARLMSTSLTQLGYRVRVAHDGHEALSLARSELPSAVVLDLVMPRLDGFGFLRQFRAEERWARVPVLVWTVKDLSREEQVGLLESATAVLPKDGTGARALVDTIRHELGVPSVEVVT
jgi:DNA-binding response OmpR family regulator/anti-sigma regulatory factor (Ser/Thr protein kinase)